MSRLGYPISCDEENRVKPEPVTDYAITPHAAFEINRRDLSEDIVRTVLAEPEQRLEVRPGRIVLQ